ncbi:uncharacterized protein LOC117170093 [Belonocnema kinseyi]|uniref:uncharacterized protein LOC117170093 n=1 Tax=Belonocnema kinseyi TaxID=2817044 RepID=UPI00143CC9C9|nr:uncharacterized protein LOC117170093 [Belonocnema kinseyi]
MNIQGIVLDENNKSIRQGNKILCDLGVANGGPVYEFVEVDLLASLSTGIPSANNIHDGAGSSQSYGVENIEANASSNKSDALVELTGNMGEIPWNSKRVKLWIESFREVTEDKSSKKMLQKEIWLKIANKVNNTLTSNVSGAQCDSKWKGLMKTYKKHKMSEQTTGEAEHVKENDKSEPQNNTKITEKMKSCKNKKRNKKFVNTESGNHTSSEDEKQSNDKRTKYRRTQSMGKEMCLLLKKKHEYDKILREGFVSTFEKYVQLVENENFKFC